MFDHGAARQAAGGGQVSASTANYRAGIESSDSIHSILGGGPSVSATRAARASAGRASSSSTLPTDAGARSDPTRHPRKSALQQNRDVLATRAQSSLAPSSSASSMRPRVPFTQPIQNVPERRMMSHARFDSMKKANPFGQDTHVSNDLPCHVNHGSCRNEIQWDISPEQMHARAWALLVVAATGLKTRTHPHAIKSRKGFTDLCTVLRTLEPHALKAVMGHIRDAMIEGLNNNPDKTQDVFLAAVEALSHLSEKFGEALTPLLGPLLAPLSKALRIKQCSERVDALLHTLCRNGSEETAKIINKRIPCFTSS